MTCVSSLESVVLSFLAAFATRDCRSNSAMAESG